MHCYYSKRYCFYWKKKHDKACIYCYILLQSFPRMNYFNTTILLICSYICHHKQLKQGNLRLKNTDKELCFLQRHVPGYLKMKKNTEADISVFSIYLCKEKIAASRIILSIMHLSMCSAIHKMKTIQC